MIECRICQQDATIQTYCAGCNPLFQPKPAKEKAEIMLAEVIKNANPGLTEVQSLDTANDIIRLIIEAVGEEKQTDY